MTVVCAEEIESALGTSVLPYTTPTNTPSRTSMPARAPARIYSRRRRRCFFDRWVRPFGLLEPRFAGRPPAVRPVVPRAWGAPEREAVVRARPPAAGRPAAPRPPAPPRPLPPPPVGR